MTDETPFSGDLSNIDHSGEVEREELSSVSTDIYELLLDYEYRVWHYTELILFEQGAPQETVYQFPVSAWLREQQTQEILDEESLAEVEQELNQVVTALQQMSKAPQPKRALFHLVSESNHNFVKAFVKLRDSVTSLWAVTDPLTEVYRRDAIEPLLEQQHAMVERGQFQHVLAMLDIDYFKKLNDEFGHLVGDQALKLIGQYLTQHSRKQDVVFRYGGEEFLISMPRTGLPQAKIILERIRLGVAKLSIPTGNGTTHLTVSIGCCELLKGYSLKHAIAVADEALYQAKENGRNLLVVSTHNSHKVNYG